MASVFLGINDRTFTYESTQARAEHVGTGVRYPIDFALTSDDVAYIVNRGREDRPDGTRLTVIRLGEEGRNISPNSALTVKTKASSSGRWASL
jgi:hypothetical protein